MNNSVINSYLSLSFFILCDLFIFPLVNVGPISLRISYIIILIIFIKKSFNHNFYKNSLKLNPKSIVFISIFLIFISVIGHFFANINEELVYNFESYKSMIYIAFMAIAYVAGKNTTQFDVNKLKICFYLVILVNIFFTAGVNTIPDPLFNLYFPVTILNSEFAQTQGIQSISSLRSWYRPLGPHGSPTYSAFAISIIYTFLTVAHLKNLITTKGLLERSIILVSPITLSLFYSSRTEFIFTTILSIILYHFWFLKKIDFSIKLFRLAAVLITTTALFTTFSVFFDINSKEINLIDLNRFGDFLHDPLSGGSGKIRSTFMFDHAWNRFISSPLFGTGFGMRKDDPSNIVWYYHNDFFYILVTTGLLGLATYLLLMKHYIIKIHYALLLPFLLTGLTNSFLLVLPMVVAYFYLLGTFSNIYKDVNKINNLSVTAGSNVLFIKQ